MLHKTLFSVVFVSQLANLNPVFAAENEPDTALEIAPASISDIYSDMDMRLRLAAKANVPPCEALSCDSHQEFDARVQQLGMQLSATAYAMYPTLGQRVAEFKFNVVDKKELGTASNSAGKIVIFRGLQALTLSDDALGFIIAREMGHVIGKHHVTNTSTKLIISALASVLFPAVAIIGASSAAAQASTATTLLTSAASTATSMVGSEVAISRMKPTQLAESDEIALQLSNHPEWDLRAVASILQLDEPNPNGWVEDLQVTTLNLQKTIADEEAAIALLEEECTESDAEYTEFPETEPAQ